MQRRRSLKELLQRKATASYTDLLEFNARKRHHFFVTRCSGIARLIAQTINLISRFRDVNSSPLVLPMDFAYLSLSIQEETE